VDHVNHRIATSYRPSTLGAQRQATLALALFYFAFSVPFHHNSVATLLSFLELLHFSGLAVPTIQTYFAIKLILPLGLSSSLTICLPSLDLALISLEKNYPPSISHKPVFSHPDEMYQCIF
jgi:hypothetical protein